MQSEVRDGNGRTPRYRHRHVYMHPRVRWEVQVIVNLFRRLLGALRLLWCVLCMLRMRGVHAVGKGAVGAWLNDMHAPVDDW